MIARFLYALFLFLLLWRGDSFAGTTPRIYAAMQTEDSVVINARLKELEKSDLKEKDAYTGALLMKKSGLLKSGMEKLSMFKKGKLLLEKSIKQDSLNAEYRLLRLMIQEHVPDFLKYHSRKEEDAKLIRQFYRKLPPELQEAVKNYSAHSQVLKPGDFQ